jgi:hypothetical protein
MTFISSFLGNKIPFFRDSEGREIPAFYIVGGQVRLVGGDGDDGTTVDEYGSLVVIDWIHHLVHEGEMFQASHTFLNVGDGSTVTLLITTGAKEMHFTGVITVGGQSFTSMYENPDVAGGTPVPVKDMNRNSSAFPGGLVYHSPTVNNIGPAPLIENLLLVGGTGPRRVGGDTRSGTEWELKPNEDYIIQVTNDSGGAIPISIAAEFYET